MFNGVYGVLPREIWSLIGDWLVCDVSECGDSIELILKGCRWTIMIDRDGETYILPGWVPLR